MRLVPEPDFPELQRNPISQVWYVRKYVSGKGELFRSTREKKSKAKAKAIALKILSEWMGKPVYGRIALFEEVAREVLELKAHKSKATRYSAYITFKKHLVPFFGGYRIDQVTEAMWDQYVFQSLKIDPSRRLFNHWKHFIMVMRHAFRKGFISRQIEIKNPDRHPSPGKVFSDQEIDRLIQAAGPELKLQIILASTMGMRKTEILGLTWDRVDFDKNTIHLRAQDTKIRKARTMTMSEDVRSVLLAKPKVSEFVFPYRENQQERVLNNKTAWKRAKKAAGVEGRFHDLRHTFLTNVLLRHRANPLHVAVFAGVSLAEIQKTYLHPSAESTRDVANMIRVNSGQILPFKKKELK